MIGNDCNIKDNHFTKALQKYVLSYISYSLFVFISTKL